MTFLAISMHMHDDDDDAPLAINIAGDRVNRECYMQVRGDGCTTPTLVRVLCR